LVSSAAGLMLAVWIGMAAVERSYVITAPIVLVGSVFFVRLFIIQHDCGHGAFFVSRRANDIVGSMLGVMTLTPFADWRKHHAIHHATSGNLDARGIGDIDTMTVREYLAASPRDRLLYRLRRHPLVLLGLAPGYQFLLRHRLPGPRATRREQIGVAVTNVAIALVLGAVWMSGALVPFLSVTLPMAWLAAAAGVWLFYVQHQFEAAYWERSNDWSFEASCLTGSSFYDLPAWLHWCTGNIGYHHVHHLCPRIPNYQLRACAEALPRVSDANRQTLARSLGAVRLALWEEETRVLISFRELWTGRVTQRQFPWGNPAQRM
jgi:omega-6 fatty acid desaturase (delta-12 desaturase)